MNKNAAELFLSGYNCSQAIFCAYCENFGIDFKTGAKLASSFGGGMGRMREVCGAVSGMFMIAGLKYGYFENNSADKKTEHYKLIQSLADEFKNIHGSITCKKLLGEEKDGYTPSKRTAEYYKNRPCIEFIKTADDIINKRLGL